MKSAIGLLAFAGLVLSAASSSFAGPGSQYWQTLHNAADFKALKAGDKINIVCNQCETVSETTVKAPEEAMEYCKDGGMVTCPSCKKVVKIVYKSKRDDPSTRTEVTYVDDKGHPCMFITKAASH